MDGLRFEHALEDIKPQAVLGVGGDLQHAQRQGLQDMEDAEVGGGFDRDDISRFGDGAQAEHERLGGAAGGDDVGGGDDGTAFQHAFANLATQQLGAGGKIIHDATCSGMAGLFGQHAVELHGGKNVRAGHGAAEGEDVGGDHGVKEAGVAVAEAAGHGDARWAGQIKEGLGRCFDEEPGLVPGLDEAGGFELHKGLHGGAHADAMLIADGAQGGGAFAWTQHAIMDQLGHGVGDLSVKGLRGRGGGGGWQGGAGGSLRWFTVVDDGLLLLREGRGGGQLGDGETGASLNRGWGTTRKKDWKCAFPHLHS